MIKIERLSFDEFERGAIDGNVKIETVFKTESVDDALRYWNSYCSGVSDVDPAYDDAIPFVGQNFSRARFYRIVSE